MNSDLLLSPLYKIKDEFFKRESFSNLLQIASNESQFSRENNRSFKIIHPHRHHLNHDLDKRDILRFKASTFNASSYNFNFMQVDNIVSFVDNLELAANRLIDKKNKLKTEIDLESSNKTLLDEKTLGLNVHEDQFKISQTDRESLYCELIYTIKHKIGRTIDGHNDYISDLYKYAQDVFRFNLEEHNRLVAQTNEEKPPIVILYVEIKEAKNLEAKDANGFSDPYCMLGIVPGSRLKSPEQNSSDEDTVQNLPKLITRSSMRNDSIANSSANSSSNKSSFIKRISSFRRSQKADTSSPSNRSPSLSKSNSSKKANKYTISKLPAKYIQTTDVKKETLNPVWNQKFRFQIDDINSDILHLDIWDHDDEASVFEAAKKLNEVKGLKGLDRYFKQIAQSARTTEGKDVNVDDFLGSVNIQLNDLPSNGTEKWFDLEGRSEKSKVEGKIRLRLKLATREDRGLPEDDNSNDLKQQEQMLNLFIDYELNQLSAEKKSTDWNGKLSREAETILHQHAIQGDITDFQITMCRWIAYSKKHIEKELSLKLLHERLESLDKVWSSSSPSREETDMLRQSFTLFIDHCFNVIANLNDACKVTQNRAGLTKLEQTLKLLINIYNMNAFKYCFPFHNTLAHELILLLKNNFSDRLDFLKEKCLTKSEGEDILKKLIKFTQTVYLDLYFANAYYSAIFEDILNIQYFQLMYKKVDTYASEIIKKILTEEFGDEITYGGQELVALITNTQLKMNTLSLSSSSLSSGKGSDAKFGSNPTIENTFCSPLQSPKTLTPPSQINENTAVVLFELYSNVVLISNFKTSFNEYEFITAKANTYYETFYLPFKRWIEFVKKKIDIKIEKCLENDKNEVVTETNKFSQSSVEVAICLSQASKFWKLVNWPGYLGSQIFLSDLTDFLSKAISSYANLIKAQTQLLVDTLATETKEEKKLSIFQKVIINANNLEKIRDSFRAYHLEVENKPPEQPSSNNNNIINNNNRSSTRRLSTISKSGSDIELKVNETSTYLTHLIEILIGHIFDYKITTELESHLFYLFESPESSSAHESVSRLLQYLKTNLIVFKDIALKINFERLLKSVWTKLLNAIETNIKKDNTRTTIFFSKMLEVLDILLNLFNLDNQGVAKDQLALAEKYKYLKGYLKLQTMETSRLIQLYYQDMISIQANLKASDYGVIYCRAYYHSKDETLVIEVFKCKNLEPMDPNGLSDPYVEIELKPRHLFGGEKKLTTVIKKTLNPIFNEVLELYKKFLILRGNVINFTVMDHDIVWTNDFEGEAFLEMSSLPGVRNDLGEGGYKDLKYVELHLIRPKNYPNQILDALEYRVQDKLAIEFLKERRDKLKN